MCKWLDTYTYKCAECGKKTFIMDPNQYTYKLQRRGKTEYYCSYKCYRKSQKDQPIGKYTSIK